MTPSELEEMYEEFQEVEFLKMDGYDDCIIGVCERFGQEPILAYDKHKIISKMVEEDGMDIEEAEEFFAFNQIGAWMGDKTPCFISTE